DLVERLSEALERVLVGRLGAAARGSLYRQVGALAHGIDHARLLGNVLDPGPVVVGVHRELGGADLGGGVRIGLERIADDDGHLVLHLLGGTGGHEDVGRIALAPLWLGLGGLRLGEREADLCAAGRGGIRAPIAVLAEQGGLRNARRYRSRAGLGLRTRRDGVLLGIKNGPPLLFGLKSSCGFGLALLLFLRGSQPLLLRFLGFVFCFSIGCGFGLALLLCLRGSEPLLLRFLGLAFCFSIGCGFGLALLLFFNGGQPLLLSFGSLAFCFSIGCRFCL